MPISDQNERATKELRQRIRSLPGLEAALPAIQEAAEPHPGVYLVGGAVRDTLLGADSIDIDVAVEGDALQFARDLAEALGGRVREHERFQTAVVDSASGSIDVAATRTETYESPGALPVVSTAGVGEDLARRDFTVNAMASSLKRADLGNTVDPFGGYADLHEKRIRVLHDASFKDDPTRMLRAIRYAARLDFEIEPHTQMLLGETVAAALLEQMDSGRVRDELIDLLSEDRLPAALEMMHRAGVDRALHPRLSAGHDARELAARLDRIDARVAALCLDLKPNEVGPWLDRLSFSAEDRAAIVSGATEGLALGDQLDALQGPPPSQIRQLLDRFPDAALAIASTRSDRAAGLVDRYRRTLAPVQLEINGDDLIAAGIAEGPEIGRALRDTLSLKLDGQVGGRDEQLAAALRVLGRHGGGE